MRDTPEGVDDGLYGSLLVVEVDRVWEAPCSMGGGVAPAGTTAQALGNQFAALPEFITREALTPVSAFGRNGYHLVLEVPGACTSDQMVWEGPTRGRYYQAEGQIVDYWFLDVAGTAVMVEATRPPESREEEATELTAALDALLDTLVITP